MKRTLVLVTALVVSACHATDRDKVSPADPAAAHPDTTAPGPEPSTEPTMDKGTLNLGNFSVSLAVKDFAKSRAFYEALGFEPVAGDAAHHWLILQNGACTIGLFQGGIERNTLTFNPGWNKSAQTLEQFTDVREIQRRLEERGLELQVRADPATTGPASVVLVDPDGNPVLFDQHVPSPRPPGGARGK